MRWKSKWGLEIGNRKKEEVKNFTELRWVFFSLQKLGAIRTRAFSAKENDLMLYSRQSQHFTVFATEAAGIVCRLAHISALCTLSFNAIKCKARAPYR